MGLAPHQGSFAPPNPRAGFGKANGDRVSRAAFGKAFYIRHTLIPDRAGLAPHGCGVPHGGGGIRSPDLLQELSIQHADLQAHDRRSLSNKTDTHCHILISPIIKISAINKWETDKADMH